MESDRMETKETDNTYEVMGRPRRVHATMKS